MIKKKITDDFLFLNGWGYVRKNAISTLREEWTDERTEKEKYNLIITLNDGMILKGYANTALLDDFKEPNLQDGTELDDLEYISDDLEWSVVYPLHYPDV